MMAFAAVALPLLLLLSHGVQPLMAVSSSRLPSPPPGNSLAISAIALDGKLKYVCEKDGGQWFLVQKRATLMDQTNHTKVIGFYTRNYHLLSSSSRHVGTWTIINSEGDEAESGHHTSLVSGNKLVITRSAQNKLPEFLAQASLHRYEGAARRVSYIAELNTELLSSPPMSDCEANKSAISIGYKAKYAFWTQDLLPPKVPSSLLVPSQHHVVESFFARGNIRFTYDHKIQSWRQHRVLAKLYDVPGGVKVGGFSYNISFAILANSFREENSSALACIDINDPNGFKVCGTQEITASSSARQASLPWSLFHVTSNNGYITQILGPFTFFHMVSTWGGLPPQTSNNSSVSTTLNGWKSYFTAIFWLYTSKGA